MEYTYNIDAKKGKETTVIAVFAKNCQEAFKKAEKLVSATTYTIGNIYCERESDSNKKGHYTFELDNDEYPSDEKYKLLPWVQIDADNEAEARADVERISGLPAKDFAITEIRLNSLAYDPEKYYKYGFSCYGRQNGCKRATQVNGDADSEEELLKKVSELMEFNLIRFTFIKEFKV